MIEERHYVYHHLDPETKEVVYVGHGCGARAWLGHTPFRDELHAEYLGMLESTGYTPDEWVRIVYKNLPKTEACNLERRDIKILKPRYNKIQGSKLLKFTPDLYQTAVVMRAEGASYATIAKELGLSTMVIHRGLNGKNPALEELLERTI